MRPATITAPLFAAVALVSLGSGHALAQGCEEHLARLEGELQQLDPGKPRRAEAQQAVKQARAVARGGDDEACQRIARHLEFTLTSLAAARPGERRGREQVEIEVPETTTLALRAEAADEADAQASLRGQAAGQEPAMPAQTQEEPRTADQPARAQPAADELMRRLERVRGEPAREGVRQVPGAPPEAPAAAPQESGSEQAAAPAEEPAPGPCGASVEVGPGDTLYGIARRCETTVAALTEANPEIRDPTLIRIGQTIVLPGPDAGRTEAPEGAGVAGQQSAAATPPAARAPAAGAPDPGQLEEASGVRNAQVTLMQAEAEGRSGPDGQQPQEEAPAGAQEPGAAQGQASDRAPGACAESVEVEQGDTFYGIARRCGTTVEALRQANPEIADPTVIRIGQTIRIPAS